MKKIISLSVAVLLSVTFFACSSSDDNPVDAVEVDAWVGTWLSAGTDVAPILVSLFKYDSVKVQFKEDLTVSLQTHVKDGAWSTLPGVFTITKSETGDVHSININYSAFEQGGIIQVIPGTQAKLKLEVVQTVPNIGAVPRTPATGFGSDAALGTLNIQNYVKIN
ncbi:MAG: hypothetical protein KJ571_09965 [Bacteroidetes bacterium]|nr:hypothetical protein [Bacteroidota bacterium]